MAPDQERAVKFWADEAWDALDTAEKLLHSKKYQHSLFFCHLAVEKALKSRYIASQNKLPPCTHDLQLLASKFDAGLSKVELANLNELTTFNIAGRYRAEKLDLFNKATAGYTGAWLKNTREIVN